MRICDKCKSVNDVKICRATLEIECMAKKDIDVFYDLCAACRTEITGKMLVLFGKKDEV